MIFVQILICYSLQLEFIPGNFPGYKNFTNIYYRFNIYFFSTYSLNVIS
jgi:hypothetical protein